MDYYKKYIKKLSYYKINEQMFDENSQSNENSLNKDDEKTYKFIFLDDTPKYVKKYPDGTIAKEYFSYECTKKEAEEWINNNIKPLKNEDITNNALDIKRKNILDLILGKKSIINPEDKKFVSQLKNAVSVGIFGKKGPSIEVWFSPDGDAFTDNIEVTLIRS